MAAASGNDSAIVTLMHICQSVVGINSSHCKERYKEWCHYLNIAVNADHLTGKKHGSPMSRDLGENLCVKLLENLLKLNEEKTTGYTLASSHMSSAIRKIDRQWPSSYPTGNAMILLR